MLNTPRLTRFRHGFTLIELLVVIAIIAILASVFVVAVGSAFNAAKRAQAQNDLHNIVTAIYSFRTDYGGFPIPASMRGQDVTFGESVPYTSQLMDVLRMDFLGWDDPNGTVNINPRRNRYLLNTDFPFAQDAAHPKSGIGPDGQPYDPWGRTYIIRIDGDYDGLVANPYSANAGSNPLTEGVIGWSFGQDSQGGQGDKNVAPAKDDVISW